MLLPCSRSKASGAEGMATIKSGGQPAIRHLLPCCPVRHPVHPQVMSKARSRVPAVPPVAPTAVPATPTAVRAS
jgi:hypothetical protein